jgi:hypothetical protein
MIMRTVRWASWLGAVAVTVAFMAARPAVADVASDRAAAIVQYPKVSVDSGRSHDTVIQLSNTSDELVYAHCFYINANSHCSNTGDICDAAEDCCSGDVCGTCDPGCNETDFRIRLTPRQPLGWLASEGLSEFPIDGVLRVGVGGASNAGSRIPGVPEDPFIGELKCIVTDNTGTPIDKNVLKGEATLTDSTNDFDVAKYNAVGIQAMEGQVNGDKELVLGGPEAEYNGCPSILILNHFFDGVTDPLADGDIETELVLTPCTEDLLRQVPASTVVQYLVYNEFEQRFSTSRTVWCQQVLELSEIDTTQSERSIFSAGVAGTVTGQTRMSPLEGGLLAVAIEEHGRDNSAAFNVHFQGDRAVGDMITLP